jgi:hypothetical protein
MTHSVDIVVARHGEDVRWVRDMRGCRVIIDNTTKDIPEMPDLRMTPGTSIVCLQGPDTGGESGAYLRYILSQYGLAETVVFTQANFGDHTTRQDRPFVQTVLGYREKPVEKYTPLGDPCMIHDHYGMGLPLPRSPLVQYGANPLMDSCLYVFGKAPPKEWEIAHGAVFAIPREAILKHPREFYVKLEEWVCHAPRTFEQAMMERLWPLVFTEW